MKHLNRTAWLFAALVLTIWGGFPVAGHTDGESRPATDQEKAYYHRVMTTLHRALPPIPSDWEVLADVDNPDIERVGVGAEEYPFTVTCTVEWRNTPVVEAMEQRRAEVFQEMADQGQPVGLGPEREKQIETLAAAMGQAAEKGDVAEMERLQKDMEALAADIDAVVKVHDQAFNAKMKETGAEDVGAKIWIHINRFQESLYGPASQEPPLAGNDHVYRIPADPDFTGDLSKEGITYVFIGRDWRMTRNESTSDVETHEAAGLPHTAVQTVYVMVQASDERARNLLKQMDWGALKGLLKN